MIYRGRELRCIAEIRAESGNHGGGRYIWRGAASRRRDEDETVAASDKNRRVFFSGPIFRRPARNGAPFNNAIDIE